MSDPIPPGDLSGNTRRGMGPRRIASVLTAVCIVLAAAWVARFIWYDQPRLLREAGPIALDLASPIPPPGLLPPRDLPGNAADDYLRALNHYNARCAPMLARRTLNPILREPAVSPVELHNIIAGARKRACSFYSASGGSGSRIFIVQPGSRPYPMRRTDDPFALRPYIAPMRTMAQACLNRGKELEQAGHLDEARRIYMAVVRLGWNLRQDPGCLMDIELSLEIERKGLHYLEVFLARTHAQPVRELCHRYAQEVEGFLNQVHAKYVQLDNPEAAKLILRRDASPIWRMEAAVALSGYRYTAHPGILERLSIRLTLLQAEHDADPCVRRAARHAALMGPADWRNMASDAGPRQ
ncbi:MAG: hypothetical protein ACP5VE_13050 [Chthonomonadales bacterium]